MRTVAASRVIRGIFSAAFFTVISAVAPLWATDTSTHQPVPVSVIIPLSGDLASFGYAFRQGIELKLSEGNARRMKITFEDDRSGIRAATVSALQAQIRKSQVKIVVVTAISTIIPVDAIVSKEGIIAFSAFDSSERIEVLSANSFGYGWSNELTGKTIGEYACDALRIRSVAIVDGQDEWSEIMSHAFDSAIKRCGAEIRLQDRVDLSATDFRSLAAKIARVKPDGVYLPLYGPALTSFIKQLRQAGYSGTLLSAEGITEKEVAQLGVMAEGMYITSAYLFDDAFQKRYREKFGVSAATLNLAHVALGYEWALFMERCLEQLQVRNLPANIDNLRAAIQSVEVSGPLGAVSFRGHKRLARGQGMMKVVGGAILPVSPTAIGR